MTRVISLSDDAYDMLKDLKAEGESFSDVVRKIVKTQEKSFSDYIGILKEDSVEWGRISKELENQRRSTKPRKINSLD
ncbi:antitoxin VapB family protein [Candidatus Woesearchaeota archaeon]|nr:antitoxin VapB family protein [Candidatus Woesearchaeota archaeon]